MAFQLLHLNNSQFYHWADVNITYIPLTRMPICGSQLWTFEEWTRIDGSQSPEPQCPAPTQRYCRTVVSVGRRCIRLRWVAVKPLREHSVTTRPWPPFKLFKNSFSKCSQLTAVCVCVILYWLTQFSTTLPRCQSAPGWVPLLPQNGLSSCCALNRSERGVLLGKLPPIIRLCILIGFCCA